MERERMHFGALRGAGGDGSVQDGCGLHGASLPTAASPLLLLLKLCCFMALQHLVFTGQGKCILESAFVLLWLSHRRSRICFLNAVTKTSLCGGIIRTPVCLLKPSCERESPLALLTFPATTRFLLALFQLVLFYIPPAAVICLLGSIPGALASRGTAGLCGTASGHRAHARSPPLQPIEDSMLKRGMGRISFSWG